MDKWDLQWGVQRSQRYHARRTAFFDRWHKGTAFAGIVGGSAVFAAIGNAVPAWVATAGAAMVVAMCAIDLVVDTAGMARTHNDLRRRFCQLEADMAAAGQDASQEQLAAWLQQRLAIESDEPPHYAALNVLCDNELARSYRHLKQQQPHHIPWFQRMTAHLLRWENA